jgi:hypothetical protein
MRRRMYNPIRSVSAALSRAAEGLARRCRSNRPVWVLVLSPVGFPVISEILEDKARVMEPSSYRQMRVFYLPLSRMPKGFAAQKAQWASLQTIVC